MDLNMTGVLNYLSNGYHDVMNRGGILAGHAVQIFHKSLRYIEQDVRMATAAFMLANMFFIKIAMQVAEISDKFFIFLAGPKIEKNEKLLLTKNMVLLVGVGSLLVGMNYALAKALNTKLSAVAIAAVSIASCANYILFCLWAAS